MMIPVPDSAVTTLQQAAFGNVLSQVLSPSRPLQSEEFLRGRGDQLDGIKKSLHMPGRHILIHGLRGVGKSSLAQSAAFGWSTERDPILLACDKNTTLGTIIKEIYEKVVTANPALEKQSVERGGLFSAFGFGASSKTTSQIASSVKIESVNDAVRAIEYVCKLVKCPLIIVIDEFDQIISKDVQVDFTNFIKQVSDQHINAKFIICGIGESAEAIMVAHGSADRFFHTVNLGQLPWEPRFEIVEFAAEKLGIVIDRTTTYRIARISDGFPHYVHFISEKLFWRVYEAKNGGIVDGSLFERAMSDAAESMEIRLRGPYEKATQKYSNEYSHILWAAADGHELQRRSTDIYQSYLKIVEQLKKSALVRDKFNTRMHSLKQESHGFILSGSRQGWYEFTEKVIRGYVRLRAEQANVVLHADHPAGPRAPRIRSF